jgi:hypothetical protein
MQDVRKTGHEVDPKLEANIAAIWKAVEKIGDPVEDLSDLLGPALACALRRK